jgi:hypothetical protein
VLVPVIPDIRPSLHERGTVEIVKADFSLIMSD